MIAVGDKLYSASGAVYEIRAVGESTAEAWVGQFGYEMNPLTLQRLDGMQLYTREQYDRLLLARGLRKALERFARDASDQKIITACTAAGIGAEKERVGE